MLLTLICFFYIPLKCILLFLKSVVLVLPLAFFTQFSLPYKNVGSGRDLCICVLACTVEVCDLYQVRKLASLPFYPSYHIENEG